MICPHMDVSVDDLSVHDISVHDIYEDCLSIHDIYVDHLSLDDLSVHDTSARRVKGCAHQTDHTPLLHDLLHQYSLGADGTLINTTALQ